MFPLCTMKSPLAAVFGVVCLGLSSAAGAQTAPPPTPAVSAAPAAGAADAVPVLPGDYRLAPDDQIDVTVEGHEEFNKSVTVSSHGTFSYFGRTVAAADMTVEDLERDLTRGLKSQLRYPQVTASVRQAHVRQVSVIGTARAPGMYNYRPGMRVLDAIANSGGPTQVPEMTDATLVTDGGTRNEPVDLAKLMDGTDPSLNVPLQPGDILLMQARNPATSMVLIRGQVAHEGQYPVRREGATIMAILTQAGGVLPTAAITRVQLTHDGQTRVLNLRRSTLFDTTAPDGQTMITAGDTIAVPLNNLKYMVLGEVNSRNVYPLPDGEPVTVTRALAQAGGPTGDTDLKNVEIIRAGQNNRVSYIPVNVDDILNRKSVNDPALQDADILYFPKRKHGGNTTGAAQGILGGLFSFSALSTLLRGGL